MHLVYIDDSHDQETDIYTFSALLIKAERWRDVFSAIRQFRKNLKEKDGIPVTKEFHAWKFVSGRGNISERIVPKGRRCAIFVEALDLFTKQNGVSLMNVVLKNNQDRAFERLINRINRNMVSKGSHALLICDEGKEIEYTKLVRRMTVHNYIPSKLGTWEGGVKAKNIPVNRIVEDPFFKNSEQSYFIQMADFCAYALLRKEAPLASKNKYGLDKAFQVLSPICVKAANRDDPFGIIR
jgi:hypothetical protein